MFPGFSHLPGQDGFAGLPIQAGFLTAEDAESAEGSQDGGLQVH